MCSVFRNRVLASPSERQPRTAANLDDPDQRLNWSVLIFSIGFSLLYGSCGEHRLTHIYKYVCVYADTYAHLYMLYILLGRYEIWFLSLFQTTLILFVSPSSSFYIGLLPPPPNQSAPHLSAFPPQWSRTGLPGVTPLVKSPVLSKNEKAISIKFFMCDSCETRVPFFSALFITQSRLQHFRLVHYKPINFRWLLLTVIVITCFLRAIGRQRTV